MSHKRINRHVPGEHLCVTQDGDVRHSDQVTMGLYGAQRGQIVDIDDLDGPDTEEMQRRTRERYRVSDPLKWPVTGPETQDN